MRKLRSLQMSSEALSLVIGDGTAFAESASSKQQVATDLRDAKHGTGMLPAREP